MRVTLTGTGLMGYPMVETLLNADYEVIAWNRTREKAEPLEAQGATIVETPAEAIREAECTILMVTDAAAIESVLFGNNVDYMGKTIIQMGTIAPEESRDFSRRITNAGGDYLEAPVLGNKGHAADGELIVMVGGTMEQFNRWRILLKTFGKNLHHVGPIGSAAALKLALNQFIASITATFGLSLRLVQKNDVDTDLFMGILRDSALYSPQYDKKLPRILEQDYDDPNFPTQHLLKDVDLVIQAAETAHLETAAIDGVKKVIQNAMEKGFRETDYSSLVEGIDFE